MTTLFSPHFYFSKEKKNPDILQTGDVIDTGHGLCVTVNRVAHNKLKKRLARISLVCAWRSASGLTTFWFFLTRTFRVSFTDFSFFVLAPNDAYHLQQLPTLSQGPTLEACHMVLHPDWQMRAIFTLAASDNSCPTSKTLMFLVCYKLTKDWAGAWVLCQWDTGHVVLQILNKQCQRNG